MPIKLADAKQLSQDKLTDAVIDEFARSPIINALPFDNTVKAQGGRSLTYVHNRVTTQPTAGSRALNSEYTPQETATTQVVTNLKVMGGAFEVDRVIARDEVQVVDHVTFQSEQKAKATVASFHDQMINGDSAIIATDFDGLDKVLTGTSTEVTPVANIDLSTTGAVTNTYRAFLYHLRKMVGKMSGAPTHILMNSDMYTAFQAISDIVPNITFTRNEMGDEVGRYGSAILVEMGDKPGSSDPIIGNAADGTTSLYAIRVGMDGFHGVSPDGTDLINIYAPDMNAPGAVKKGEVEIVAATVLKATKAAAVLRNIKVV
ncbi:phage capsid protein [Candidatus Saccharibacteria bacterium]|nr:phage capsid protein [Candidatus Saccharibacteria bacterium]